MESELERINAGFLVEAELVLDGLSAVDLDRRLPCSVREKHRDAVSAYLHTLVSGVVFSRPMPPYVYEKK